MMSQIMSAVIKQVCNGPAWEMDLPVIADEDWSQFLVVDSFESPFTAGPSRDKQMDEPSC